MTAELEIQHQKEFGMDNNAGDLREKIRQQFDTGPYPRIALEESPKNNAKLLYIHNLVNSYYLRNKKLF